MAEISIIVPVYQAQNYLRSCLDSILCQSFSDFELILVDDGSPDNCGEICEEYAARDSRIRVLHQENQGQAAARNHGMQIARGSWICFVDSDDLIHPQMVEALHQGAQSSGTGVSMCRMLEAEILTEDFYGPRRVEFDRLTMDEKTLTELYDREEYPGWVACAKLIRRDLVDGYLFTPGRVYEDNEAVCRWLCRGEILALTGEKLYFYRTNPISTTQSSFSPKRLDYLWALESILQYYRSLGYLEMARRFCDRYAQAAADSYRSATKILHRQDLGKRIKRDAWRLYLRDRVPFTGAQLETMLEGMYPRITICCWTLQAGIRTLRKAGLSGFFRKVMEQLRRGDRA